MSAPMDLPAKRYRFLPTPAALLATLVVGAYAETGRSEELHPHIVPATSSDFVVDVVPEYDRELRRVLISFPDGARRFSSGVAPAPVPAFIQAAHHELLDAIPDYAEIGVIVGDRNIASVLAWEKLYRDRDNVHLHIIRGAQSDIDLWTQDLGEFIRRGGEGRFLVSALPAPDEAGSHELARSRVEVAKGVFHDNDVEIAPFVYEGGNMMFDRGPSGLRVIVGEDTVLQSVRAAQSRGESTRDQTVAKRISETFGGAEVVVLSGRQTRYLPHIDQAFVLLRGGVAVVNRIENDGGPEQELLDGYRRQLEALGYRTVILPTTAEDIRSFRNSLNAVPFTHRESGEVAIIFPVFPGEVRPDARGNLEKKHLIGKAAAAYELFSEQGYRPLPVRDVAHVLGGNTHCIAYAVN